MSHVRKRKINDDDEDYQPSDEEYGEEFDERASKRKKSKLTPKRSLEPKTTLPSQSFSSPAKPVRKKIIPAQPPHQHAKPVPMPPVTSQPEQLSAPAAVPIPYLPESHQMGYPPVPMLPMPFPYPYYLSPGMFFGSQPPLPFPHQTAAISLPPMPMAAPPTAVQLKPVTKDSSTFTEGLNFFSETEVRELCARLIATTRERDEARAEKKQAVDDATLAVRDRNEAIAKLGQIESTLSLTSQHLRQATVDKEELRTELERYRAQDQVLAHAFKNYSSGSGGHTQSRFFGNSHQLRDGPDLIANLTPSRNPGSGFS